MSAAVCVQGARTVLEKSHVQENWKETEEAMAKAKEEAAATKM